MSNPNADSPLPTVHFSPISKQITRDTAAYVACINLSIYLYLHQAIVATAVDCYQSLYVVNDLARAKWRRYLLPVLPSFLVIALPAFDADRSDRCILT